MAQRPLSFLVNERGAIQRVKEAMALHQYLKGYPEGTNFGKKKINSTVMAPSKRRYKRKNTRRRRIVKRGIPRNLAPRTKLIKCTAVKQTSISMTTGAMSTIFIQGNSIDDPFTALGTGQPLGYDQYKSLYDKAIVLGSKVSLTFYNGGTVPVIFGLCPMPVSQANTSLSLYDYYGELPGNKQRLLSPDVDHSFLVSKVSTKKHLKKKDLRDCEDLTLDLGSETPPSELFYWHLYFQPADQTTTVSTAHAVIKVEYIVLLKDPIIPARSVET